MVPQGKTVRDQMEAWRDAQPQAKRSSAFRLAGLERLYETMVQEGELSLSIQRSLKAPSLQAKLARIEIDMEETWVDMAKAAVDPTRDWFPEVATRQDVIELVRPYSNSFGNERLSRMFLGGRDIASLFRTTQKRLPSFDLLVALLRFCVEDERNGGERKQWNAATVFFLEGQWAVFGRGRAPFPELTGEEEFNAWFTSLVPHERVDHVATALNKSLGQEEFTPPLLIDWRKGVLPSREKFDALLRGIVLAFPDWLPEGFHASREEYTEAP
ncbi:hypothetical protein HY631_00180, partial [Candidatus Uhrbacteria bacterium]|nr:hypothetical protein [Candidatus Uhrbacteria bacterium]